MLDTDAIIDAYYAALKAGDTDALKQLLSSQMQVDYYGPTGLFPWQGAWHGHDGFFAFLKAVGDNLTIDSVSIQQRIVTGNTVLIVLEGQWTLRANSAKVSAIVANIFTLSEGKIERYQVFTDTAAFGLAAGTLEDLRPA